MTIALRSTTDTIIAAMGSIAAAPAVGDGQAPEPRTFPYVIVTSSIGEREILFGLSAGLGALEVVYQISVVAENRMSLDVVSDQVRAVMLDPTVVLDNAQARVRDRRLVSGNLQDDPDQIIVRRDMRFSMKLTAP